MRLASIAIGAAPVLLTGWLVAGCSGGMPDPPAVEMPLWSARAADGTERGGGLEAITIQGETGERVEITFIFSPGETPSPETIGFWNTVLGENSASRDAHSRLVIALPGAWGFDPGEHPGGRLRHELVASVELEDRRAEGIIALMLELRHPVAISFAVAPAGPAISVVLAREN